MTQPTDPPTRWERDNPVAPRERVNIVYRMAAIDEEIELPLKILVIGDFTGRRECGPTRMTPMCAVYRNFSN